MTPATPPGTAPDPGLQRWLPWLAIAAMLIGLDLGLRLAALIGPWLASTPWPAGLREPVLLYVNFLAAVLPLTLIERWTSGTGQPRPLLRGLGFWAVAILLAWLVTLLTREILAALGLKPLLSLKALSELPAALAWLSGAGLLWLMMVVYDFFYYWFHRWQHTYGWLWRVHRVHHAIDDLSAANSYHHALEDLLRLPVVTIPFSLLIEVQVPTLALISAFVAGWGWSSIWTRATASVDWAAGSATTTTTASTIRCGWSTTTAITRPSFRRGTGCSAPRCCLRRTPASCRWACRICRQRSGWSITC